MSFRDSFRGASPLAVGTAALAGRQLLIVCTTAGNVSVKFVDGSTLVVPVAVGVTSFTWEVVKINTSGTTATASYYNLR